MLSCMSSICFFHISHCCAHCTDTEPASRTKQIKRILILKYIISNPLVFDSKHMRRQSVKYSKFVVA